MQIDVRGVTSPQAREFYISATPTVGSSVLEQGRELFAAIRDILQSNRAWICQERVFAPRSQMSSLQTLRGEIYADLADAVEPAWLVSPGQEDRIGGVQVHAVCGLSRPTPLMYDGVACGREFELDGHRWVTASGIAAPEAGPAPAQARAAFEKAQAVLKQAGTDMRSVARTWIFMDRILDWYAQFNQARTAFFRDHGVIGRRPADNRMPASTGIGVTPVGEARCMLDVYAVVGPAGAVKRHHAAGRQRSAFEYGSAFARASRMKSPAGQTIFVSGTAAIDDQGHTCFVDDPAGQIRMTLDNVTAVLGQMDCSPRDVVQAIAYCTNMKVKELFERSWAGKLPWPWITLIGDVCREDLLFEVEATACPGATKL